MTSSMYIRMGGSNGLKVSNVEQRETEQSVQRSREESHVSPSYIGMSDKRTELETNRKWKEERERKRESENREDKTSTERDVTNIKEKRWSCAKNMIRRKNSQRE